MQFNNGMNLKLTQNTLDLHVKTMSEGRFGNAWFAKKWDVWPPFFFSYIDSTRFEDHYVSFSEKSVRNF